MTDRIGEGASVKHLSLKDLIDMDGFRGVDPNEVFGVDFEGTDFSKLPALAQSYAGIGSALSGQPLDSWTQYGMHVSKAPLFKSFTAFTHGLSGDEKVRAVVILTQYLKDIAKRRPDFREYRFEMETLVSAEQWIHLMLAGIDDETRTACAEAGVPGFETPKSETEAVDDARAAAEVEHTKAGTGLQAWLRKVLGRA